MDTLTPNRLKKSFLHTLIASVSLSALLGILALLIGNFGRLEARILLTTLTVSAASIGGLACGAALETGRARRVPLTGIALAILAAVMVIAGIWADPHSDPYWKSAGTVAIFAAAASHLSLLLLARLSPRFRWSTITAHVVVLSLAGLATVMMWWELDEEFLFRLLGVVAILTASISILIPIFHRLSRGDLHPGDGSATLLDLDLQIQELEIRLNELRERKRQLESKYPTTLAR